MTKSKKTEFEKKKMENLQSVKSMSLAVTLYLHQLIIINDH